MTWNHLLLVLPFLMSLSENCEAMDVEKYDLLMPNVKPNVDELYLCTPIRVDPDHTYYIVGFEPNATMETAHHIILYGCSVPGSSEPVWNCGEMNSNEVDTGYKTSSPCESDSQIIYAWARDAPDLILPPGVGFKVGGNSPIQYIVLQVHYLHKFPENAKPDNSGVVLEYTKQSLSKLAGVFLLGTSGGIPPMQTELMETSCRMTEDKIIHPFAFRTHTHALGKSVSGYVVRQHQQDDDWILLGQRNPQTPQMFYPVENTSPIHKGDVLAARCIMANDHSHWTMIGPTKTDEMCNFYLMYWVENDEPLSQKYCFSKGPPEFYWSTSKMGFNLNQIPGPETNAL